MMFQNVLWLLLEAPTIWQALRMTPSEPDARYTVRNTHGPTHRDLLDPLAVAGVATAVVTVVVMLAALAAPAFPNKSITLSQRLFYNALCGVIGASVCYCAGVVVLFMQRFRGTLETGVAWTAAMLVAAVPCTAVAHVAQLHLFSHHADLAGHYLVVATVLIAWSVPFFLALSQYAKYRDRPVTAVPREYARREAPSPAQIAMSGPVDPPRMAERGADGQQAAVRSPNPGAARAEPQHRFLRRLAPMLSGELIYVKTNGHYIDVHTTLATSSVLMRFADAIDELGGIGMRVHRSYWVAHDQVKGWLPGNQRSLVRLTGDRHVPVSRTYLNAVRAAYRRLSEEPAGKTSAGAEIPLRGPRHDLSVPASNR